LPYIRILHCTNLSSTRSIPRHSTPRRAKPPDRPRVFVPSQDRHLHVTVW
jgi:hypothetical protein